LLVKEIMSPAYPALYEDELVTKARALIREQGFGILPIINKQKRLIGVISRRSVLAITSSVSAIRAKGVMSEPNFLTTLDTDAVEAGREMVRLDSWYAPVVDSISNKVYTGVLGLENLIEALVKQKSPKLMKPVYEFMSTKMNTCSPADEIDNVWRSMQDTHLHGLFIVRENKLLGVVTEKDLLESGAVFPAFESKKGRFRSPTKISSIMRTPAVTLKEATSLKEAARLMLEKKFGRLPIMDERGSLLGVIDRKDVVKALL
jgi:CBS domain-containing protein